MKCKHKDFHIDGTVARLEDIGKFQLCIRIECLECHKPFRFLGLPFGVDLEGAAISADSLEARLSIAPEGEVSTVIDSESQGFSIRRV